MKSRQPKKANIINFADAKVKARLAAVAAQVGWLVQEGYDLTTLDTLYRQHVTNEKKQVPEIAAQRRGLEDLQKSIKAQQAMVAQALPEDMLADFQAHLAESLEMARGLENELIMAQLAYLDSLGKTA